MKLPAFFKTQKFYSLFSSVFNSGIALVTLALLTRALTKQEFGNWAFFLTVTGFFEMGMNGLVKTPVIRMAANSSDYKYTEVLSSAWDILIKTTLVVGILIGLGFLLAGYVADDPLYYKIAYWFPLYSLLSIPQLIGMWNSNALMKFQRILVIRSVSVTVFLIGVSYVYFTNGRVESIFWFYLLATLCTSAWVISRGWGSFKCYLRYKKSYRKEILNFGKFSMGTTLSTSALTNSDALIIIYFLGPEALAIYEIPRRIRRMYNIPLLAIVQLSYPHLSKKLGNLNSKQFRVEFERILGFSFLALLPLPVLIFIFADFLVTLLGGSEYAGSADILRVFAVVLFMAPFDRFSGLILDVLNRPNINLNKVLLMLVVNIVGDVVVIQLGYGLTAVAAVTMATVAAGIIYGFIMHRKQVPFIPFKIIKEGMVQMRMLIRELKLSFK